MGACVSTYAALVTSIVGFTLLGSTSGAYAAGTTAVPASQPPGTVTLAMKSVRGTGCSAKDTTVAVSPDGQAMTVVYSRYVVERGPGAVNPGEKNCTMTVTMKVPQGWSQGIVQTDYRGFAQIAAGSTGRISARYKFDGGYAPMRTARALKGAYDGDFSFTDKVSRKNIIWSACGAQRNLEISTSVGISSGRGTTEHSLMSLDSTDVSSKSTLHFAWRKCPAGKP